MRDPELISPNVLLKILILSALVLFTFPIFISSNETTFLGPSGYIYTPSTKVLEKRKLNLGMWFNNDEFASLSFEFGLGEGIEIGACEEIPKDIPSHTSLNLNWILINEKSLLPSASLGLRDKFNYLVATKDFNIINKGHASLGFGTEDFDNYRIFGGFRITIYKEWFAIAEYNEGSINAGIKIPALGLLGVGTELHSKEHNNYFWGYTYEINLN
jgi:hypothetical protein